MPCCNLTNHYRLSLGPHHPCLRSAVSVSRRKNRRRLLKDACCSTCKLPMEDGGWMWAVLVSASWRDDPFWRQRSRPNREAPTISLTAFPVCPCAPPCPFFGGNQRAVRGELGNNCLTMYTIGDMIPADRHLGSQTTGQFPGNPLKLVFPPFLSGGHVLLSSAPPNSFLPSQHPVVLDHDDRFHYRQAATIPSLALNHGLPPLVCLLLLFLMTTPHLLGSSFVGRRRSFAR